MLHNVPDKVRNSFEKLKEYVRQQHPKGGLQTCAYCSCGYYSGGPAGTELCWILQELENRINYPQHYKRCPKCKYELHLDPTFTNMVCDKCNGANNV